MRWLVRYGIAWGTGYAERETEVQAPTAEDARRIMGDKLASAGLDHRILEAKEATT